MHGFVMTTRLILYCDTLRSDSIAGASCGGNDFVPDAVGDAADRDLEPGAILGGGGGEDVVEEVWWQTWRKEKCEVEQTPVAVSGSHKKLCEQVRGQVPSGDERGGNGAGL
jgi:hypothetical protein